LAFANYYYYNNSINITITLIPHDSVREVSFLLHPVERCKTQRGLILSTRSSAGQWQDRDEKQGQSLWFHKQAPQPLVLV
jgi:hypothetical protein